MEKFVALVFICIFIAGCGQQPAGPTPTAATPASQSESDKFESSFAEASPLCEQVFFPNSQAREPGFDINKYLAETEAGIKSLSRDFESAHGHQFLRSKIQDGDDVAKGCAEKLLGFAGDAPRH